MGTQATRSWGWFAVGVLGWLMMLLGMLANGDRLNKFDQRIIELERRIHEMEVELMRDR